MRKRERKYISVWSWGSAEKFSCLRSIVQLTQLSVTLLDIRRASAVEECQVKFERYPGGEKLVQRYVSQAEKIASRDRNMEDCSNKPKLHKVSRFKSIVAKSEVSPALPVLSLHQLYTPSQSWIFVIHIRKYRKLTAGRGAAAWNSARAGVVYWNCAAADNGGRASTTARSGAMAMLLDTGRAGWRGTAATRASRLTQAPWRNRRRSASA